jgi:hypothetical protein
MLCHVPGTKHEARRHDRLQFYVRLSLVKQQTTSVCHTVSADFREVPYACSLEVVEPRALRENLPRGGSTCVLDADEVTLSAVL